MKVILIASVEDGDRQELESIQGQVFNGFNELRDSLDFNVDIYSLDEFIDACNNTDDDTEESERINIDESWVGYAEVKLAEVKLI